MVRQSLTKITRLAGRELPGVGQLRPAVPRAVRASRGIQPLAPGFNAARSYFRASAAFQRGIMPDSDDPKRAPVEEVKQTLTPADITDAQYHELADEYLENMLSKFEQVQDARDDADVEYSAGVLTFSIGDESYVVNKQPPNKQIWLSSPRSGPKRYDFVIRGDSQNEKEGTGSGDWIYIRDGTTLSQLFHSELGIDISEPLPTSG